VERFAWYDREARKDPFVLAVLPFTIDPTGAWAGQDYTYAYPAVLEYLVQQKDLLNATAPAPINPPPDVSPLVDLPPIDMATHRVTATELNVRQYPYTGAVEPPKLGTLLQGARVTVVGVYKPDNLPFGWACLSPDGDRWVSMQWLAPV
jgi:hypothetical protein